jgi:hypothetical protein
MPQFRFHGIGSMRNVKTVMIVPMDKWHVFADPTAIDNSPAAMAVLIDGVPRGFILDMEETGWRTLRTLEARCSLFRQHMSTAQSHFHSTAASNMQQWWQLVQEKQSIIN